MGLLKPFRRRGAAGEAITPAVLCQEGQDRGSRSGEASEGQKATASRQRNRADSGSAGETRDPPDFIRPIETRDFPDFIRPIETRDPPDFILPIETRDPGLYPADRPAGYGEAEIQAGRQRTWRSRCSWFARLLFIAGIQALY